MLLVGAQPLVHRFHRIINDASDTVIGEFIVAKRAPPDATPVETARNSALVLVAASSAAPLCLPTAMGRVLPFVRQGTIKPLFNAHASGARGMLDEVAGIGLVAPSSPGVCMCHQSACFRSRCGCREGRFGGANRQGPDPLQHP